MQDSEERLMICLCQNGDLVAFERLYQRFRQDVFTMALRMSASEEIAEEVTQEVFISVYKDIRHFQFQSAFTTWLYRIVYRRVADYFRKYKKHNQNRVSPSTPENEFIYESVRDTAPTPLENSLENEKIAFLEQAIESLSTKLRAIIILRYINDYSYEEIAQILNCRIGTVKSRLSRAHNALEKVLQNTSTASLYEKETQ
jgi:RNA polymerase sigma-70 factor, ECF subfamily